jgi:Flp pilus assembly secretin CpaC
MRSLRLAMGLLVVVTASRSVADDAAPVPVPLPPRAFAQQPEASVSPEHRLLREELREKLAQRDALQREIEELSQATGTPQQIVVRMQTLEVDRTQVRNSGFDFEINDLFRKATGDAQAGIHKSNGMIVSNVIGDHLAFKGFLGMLKQNGLVRSLAEPMLVTTSGRPTKFNVGGACPIPSPGSTDAVEYHNVGTELSLVATTLGNERARIEIKSTITEADAERAILIAGREYPALRTYMLSTGFEAAFGETVVLSGLVHNRIVATKDKAGKSVEKTREYATLVFVTLESADSAIAN